MTTLYQQTKDNQWRAVAPGVEFCTLRTHADEGSTLLVRMAKGAHASLHHHPGGEETYLIKGRLRVGAHLLEPGDYLWTPPGVEHDGHAELDTEFFVVLPRGLQLCS